MAIRFESDILRNQNFSRRMRNSCCLVTLSFYRNISMGRRRRLERCKCRFESCFLYKTDVVEKRYFVGHRFESGSRPA